MGVTEILKKPYARQVMPDSEGGYFAEIIEFPGCFASGASMNEALTNLEAVAEDWLRTVIELGQVVPEPFDELLRRPALRPKFRRRERAWRP